MSQIARSGGFNIVNIQSGTPFLPYLAEALAQGSLFPDHPESKQIEFQARTQIFLPTRRACQRLRQLIFQNAGRHAVLLPNIRPLGALHAAGETALSIDDDGRSTNPNGTDGGISLRVPDRLERHWRLMQLIARWRKDVPAPEPDDREAMAAPPGQFDKPGPIDAQTAWLGLDLMRILDEFHIGEVNLGEIKNLSSHAQAEYWQSALTFLEILSEEWPQHLADRGLVDQGAVRASRLQGEIDALAERSPDDPIIIAGSTGTVPATVRLMQAVCNLDLGRIILPGLDMQMDRAAREAILADPLSEQDPLTEGASRHGHPQYALQALVEKLPGKRRDIVNIGGDLPRRRIINLAMQPSHISEGWARELGRTSARDFDHALAGCALIEARHQGEEARAIAVALRQAHENDRRAALITPDRRLARRVGMEMHRWSIKISDSAGEPLANSQAGRLARAGARMIAQAGQNRLSIATLLGLLKHEYVAGEAGLFDALSHMERGILRGGAPLRQPSDLRCAVDRALAASTGGRPGWRHLRENEAALAGKAARHINAALQPLELLFNPDDNAGGPTALGIKTLIDIHHLMLSHLLAPLRAARETQENMPVDIQAIEALFDGLRRAELTDYTVPAGEYPELFDSLLQERQLWHTGDDDLKIEILGPLEARLIDYDLVILGGLNEDIWPAAIKQEPWLNRAMKAHLGLPPPEWRIGAAAHDFTQLFLQPEVILTRTKRLDGTPVTASRWLQRLLAVAGESLGEKMTARGDKFLHWARALDSCNTAPVPAGRPNPKPPVSARPKSLSVTRIETLIRDPFAIFAREILDLRPIDPITRALDNREWGVRIHACLDEFLKNHADHVGEDAFSALINIGREQFADWWEDLEFTALWWPRFETIAAAFLKDLAESQQNNLRHLSELTAEIELGGVGDSRLTNFRLTGRIDRIDIDPQNGLTIIDYKSGQVPGKKQVNTLLAPQLPLEAVLALQGGIKELELEKPIKIHQLTYIALGSGPAPLSRTDIGDEKNTINDLAERALSQLQGLVLRYQNPEMGYLSRARLEFERNVQFEYDHLARADEWSVSLTDEES